MSLADQIRQAEYHTGRLAEADPDIVNLLDNSTSPQQIDDKIHPTTVAALVSLRDSNDALCRKLRLSKEASSSDHREDTLPYWNCFDPPMITVDRKGLLTELNLGGSMVRIKTLGSFLEHFEEHDRAEREVETGGADEGSKELHNCALDTLSLGGTDIPTSELTRALRESPIVASSLRRVYLGGNGIAHHRDGIECLSRIVTEYCVNVTTLDLRYNDISGEQISTLATTILDKGSSAVEVLHLEGNNVRCHGARALGEALNQCSLKELYLGANGIGKEGAKALAIGLRGNSTLQKLYLDGNQIGDVGADALSEILEESQVKAVGVLEHIFVDNNGIREASNRRLGHALKSGVDGTTTASTSSQ